MLEEGHSVLVAAPTGAGKTIVAEFAVHLALAEPRAKVFYTTPMKALSNQKYSELAAEHGAEQVGLLTGDTNINSAARVVVMTTEVLRNMLYADSALLRDLAFVVMDEVHYLADRFRGAVWEEVIIHLPREVRMVSLCATVSNAEEFGDWLQAVRGDTDVIVSEERPVPLEQHVLVQGQAARPVRRAPAGSGPRRRGSIPSSRGSPSPVAAVPAPTAHGRGIAGADQRKGEFRRDAVDRPAPRSSGCSNRRNLLPGDLLHLQPGRLRRGRAAGAALRTCASPRSGSATRSAPSSRNAARDSRDEDLGVLGYWDWLEGLERGVAAHHAGMLPAFKEVVEELFQRKLLKVVFATETLALGVNMPARTVVLEKLEKFNGEARVPITPGEYTQLTGRAGRRGIDVEGHSVIQWAAGLDPQAVASLASRRSYPLNSSFRPTYNMAVNLIEQFGRERTREILESSFAQFQADRAVVDLARKVREQEKSLAGYAEAMTCHLGDFAEYAGLRRELSDLERKTGEGTRGLALPSRGAAPAADHRAAPADEAAPVPRLPRPRGARPLGGALVAAQARDRPADEPDPRPHRRRRPGLRPGHRACCSTSATWSIDEHGRLLVAAPGRALRAHLRRTRPARRRVPAPRHLERPRRAGPRRPRQLSRLRAAPRRRQASGASRAAPSARLRAPPRTSGRGSTDLEEDHRLPGDEPLSAGALPRDATAGRGARGSTRCCATPTSRPATSCAG